MKNIIIIGGSYAGISTTHRILKQAATTDAFKVTIVSPNTHFYWNMASPRAIVPGQLNDEELFRPILAGFTQYPENRFEFILGSAESLDTDAKLVKVSRSTGDITISYDFLILASGSHTKDNTPFKGLGSTETTKDVLHDFQKRIQTARTIFIAGAGVTGVEVAGELGFQYGQEKEIVLVVSGSTILEECPESVQRTATKDLQNLNVNIKLQTKIKDSIETPDGRQELTLSGGEKLTTDMYIPTFGLIPNSSYIPRKFLNANGSVVVDEYLQVKGTTDVWAVGDVTNVEPSQFITCDKQSVHLAKNIVLLLENKTPHPYKVATNRFVGLQIGKKSGTGHFGSWKLPGFIIIWARKTLFIEKMGPMVDGSLF